MMPVVIVITVALWIAGILVFISEYSKNKRCTAETTAVIVDVRTEKHWRRRSGRSRLETYYYPVIEFSDRDRNFRIKTNLRAVNPKTFVIGEPLKIRYDPGNPCDLMRQANTVWEGAVGMGIFFILGAFLLYFGLRK